LERTKPLQEAHNKKDKIELFAEQEKVVHLALWKTIFFWRVLLDLERL